MDLKLTTTLAGLGTLPFIGAALILATQQPSDAMFVLGARIATSYALLIVSFMAGVHWGQDLAGIPSATPLMLVSNLLALAVWFAYLFMSPPQMLLWSAALFAVLLWVDFGLARTGAIGQAYLRLRAMISGVVVVALLVSAGALWK